LVTHRHISETDVDRAISAFGQVREAIARGESRCDKIMPMP